MIGRNLRKTTIYHGTHRHQKGVPLDAEADIYMKDVLKASGFKRMPNVQLEGYASYMKAVNKVMKSDADGDRVPDY